MRSSEHPRGLFLGVLKRPSFRLGFVRETVAPRQLKVARNSNRVLSHVDISDGTPPRIGA